MFYCYTFQVSQSPPLKFWRPDKINGLEKRVSFSRTAHPSGGSQVLLKIQRGGWWGDPCGFAECVSCGVGDGWGVECWNDNLEVVIYAVAEADQSCRWWASSLLLRWGIAGCWLCGLVEEAAESEWGGYCVASWWVGLNCLCGRWLPCDGATGAVEGWSLTHQYWWWWRSGSWWIGAVVCCANRVVHGDDRLAGVETCWGGSCCRRLLILWVLVLPVLLWRLRRAFFRVLAKCSSYFTI